MTDLGSPSPDWDIEPLTRAVAEREMDHLLALDHELIGERWDAQHWLLDLPGKWELSRVAVADGILVAYLAASMKDGRVHAHRAAVANTMHRSGVGTALMRSVAAAGLALGVREFSAKVHRSNARSIRFMERVGFGRVGEDATNFLLVGDTASIASPAPHAQ